MFLFTYHFMRCFLFFLDVFEETDYLATDNFQCNDCVITISGLIYVSMLYDARILETRYCDFRWGIQSEMQL